MSVDRVVTESVNGYLRYYDASNGDTIDVITSGPKIIQFFNTSSEMYNDSAVNSSTSVIADGYCTITTGGADNDDHDFSSGLIFDTTKGITAEAKFSITDADQSAFNFGLSESVSHGADAIGVEYEGTNLTTAPANLAIFFSDSDATTDLMRAVAVNANTDGTIISAGAALVDLIEHRYKVEIDPAGNCRFYYDNVLVGTTALGVAATGSEFLCVYFALMTRESLANTAALEYMHAWQWAS